ncbi:MAG: dihydroxy-acid dehydratase [Rubrobacteraceae bacterium]|nr:dihydroxy-acid dehydratase [Rubrobacteraceae bacterium]MBA3637422.1 dihydroxy-acid dehydratase [Rubrobacteraceae bacterium]MDQ3250871.1 dihydroxy-acid dehydratase [Actinomycetota bacterium]MDQ3498642.1 dihydroxy-acid dehydratase [Actinomycetota bacterium]
MPLVGPRIGIPFFEPSGLPDAVHDAGGEPISLRLPPSIPEGGVALAREWVADLVEISCSAMGLDGLLFGATRPEDLAGMLIAGLRLDLPTVCAPLASQPFSASLLALGLAPGIGNPANTVVSLAGSGGLRSSELVDDFSLANALRAGVAAGGGPEILVHFAAIAREAGLAGFGQMMRVLAAEIPAADPHWLREYGVPGLLASLGEALHDVPTVAGNLKENLPSALPAPGEYSRLILVRARASGAESVCRVREGVTEAAGECRVFGSENEAVSSVRSGEIGVGTMLVVGGCGPRGGPGLLRLDALGRSLEEAGLEVPVLTDGLAPEDAAGTWVSLFTPEAAAGGVIGLLRDGDTLRIDLAEGRIRTGIGAKELESREPAEFPDRADTAYAARYARAALPALEGAGFG